MRFLHLSDLHIGKVLNNYSLLDVQGDILQKILAIAGEKKPDAVFICGDIYDKGVPAESAVKMFDEFIVSLAGVCKPIFIISGNHDSAERLSFANRLLSENGVYISPAYTEGVKPISVKDEYGEVNIYMLPFVKPSAIKGVHGDDYITDETDKADYTAAIKCAIDNMHVDSSKRNVLLSHQFVAGATKSGSEEIMTVGGLDNISPAILDVFDYVALGHIHKAQNVDGNVRIHYCGTPLKYSASEAKHSKSVTLGELDGDGNISLDKIELKPSVDLIKIEGTYDYLTSDEYLATVDTSSYVYITLTDEKDIPNVYNRLSHYYERIMSIKYTNQAVQTEHEGVLTGASEDTLNNPVQVFEDFYRLRTDKTLTDEQLAYISRLCEELSDNELLTPEGGENA